MKMKINTGLIRAALHLTPLGGNEMQSTLVLSPLIGESTSLRCISFPWVESSEAPLGWAQ